MQEYIKKIFYNKIIIYLLSRYGTYALQFLTSIIIAAKLGPYEFGVYGFINLIIMYFNQLNLGIPHSLNVLLVHNKDNHYECNRLMLNSFVLYLYIALIIIISYIYYVSKGLSISNKFNIDYYIIFIVLIIITAYFNSLFFVILRIKNKITDLTIIQSLNIVVSFIFVIIVRSEKLIYTLLIIQVISNIFSFLYATRNSFFSINKKNINVELQLLLLKKGFFLFLYNSCFYFILISIRSIISHNYTIDEFGIFTFSFTMSNAVMLLLDSIMSLIYPKIINLLSSKNKSELDNALNKVRISFISSSHLLIYIAMFCFPILIYFMPKYSNALQSMNLCALAVLMNTNSYGYSTLLIAQNKEKLNAIISFSALILNVTLAYVLVYFLKVGFSYVILATLFTYLYYSFIIVKEGKRLLNIVDKTSILKEFFPVKLLLPYSIALILSICKLENLMIIVLIIFIILNIKDIRMFIQYGKKILNNSNIINL